MAMINMMTLIVMKMIATVMTTIVVTKVRLVVVPY